MAEQEHDMVDSKDAAVGEGLLQASYEGAGNNTATLVDAFERMHAFETINVTREAYEDEQGRRIDAMTENECQIVVVPSGKRLASVKPFIDQYRKFPERKLGLATLTDVDSFVAHVKRTSTVNTVLFGDTTLNAAKLIAVYDYNLSQDEGKGEARHMQHCAEYCFPYSDEWKAWTARQGSKNMMSMKEFAEFLEERIMDVVDPTSIPPEEWGGSIGDKMAKQLDITFATPSRLVRISKNLAINVRNELSEEQDIGSGLSSFTFKETRTNTFGAPVEMDSAFLIRIPVFRGDKPWLIPVQFRYRVSDERKLTFFYNVYRMDLHFFEAVKRTCEKVKAETSLPVLMGLPEIRATIGR